MAKLKAAPAPLLIHSSFDPVVSSHGYSDAQIMFIQGHPLKSELLTQLALATDEKLITSLLAENGGSWGKVYKSIYIREKLEYSGMSPKRLRAALAKINTTKYEQMLFDEIKEVCPNVIVPLDDIALGVVFPHIYNIRKPVGRKHWINCYRGSILPLREDWQQKIEPIIRVIPTYSQQLIFSDIGARTYVSLDYKRIIEESDKRSPIERPGSVLIARSYEVLRTFLNRAYTNVPKRLTFDIESLGSLPTCISLTYNGEEACTVPLLDPAISSGELALLWQLVAKALKDQLIEKNNTNIKYDWTILERFGFIVNNVRSDTAIKAKLLYPEFLARLDFWTSIYTRIPYYKDEGKEFNPKFHSRDRLYIYCGYDSLAAHQIAEAQDTELEESGMQELYETEYVPSILIYKDMDKTGILVDLDQKEKLNKKYEILYDSNLKHLRLILGNQEFNPRSNPDVGALLYEELRYPIRRKTDEETGRQSYKTDKETLDDLLINFGENNRQGKVGVELVKRIIMCRKLAKVREYVNTPLYPDNTFRGSANIARATTGRSGSGKTIDEILIDHKPWKQRCGRSLQTISKHGFAVDMDVFDDFGDSSIADDLRSMFIPRRDHLFIEGDGKAAEARFVFVLAEDYEALAACDASPSLHAKTIGLILDVDPATIGKKAPTVPKIGVPFYELGKRIRHAGHNGMRAFRLAQYTHMELSYCEMLMQKFHALNPKIRENFHNPIVELLRKTRELVSPNGRKRYFFDKINDHTINEAYCQLQQSGVSDQTKFTMWRIKEALPDAYYTKYRFLTEQHDGILAEVHKSYKDQYIETFVKIYERPINFQNCSLSRDYELIIPAEISISETNWSEMKEI